MSPATASRKERRYRYQNNTLEASSDTNVEEQVLAMIDEHPFMGYIREELRRYQLQSSAHFTLELQVQQARIPYRKKDLKKNSDRTTVLDVLFHGVSTEGYITVPVQCHLQLRRRRSSEGKWTCLVVSHDQVLEDLEKFLTFNFPTINAPLRQDALWLWWLHNGKTFNWAGLPTELKGRIVEHCMHQPHTYGIYNERLARFNWRYKNNHKIRRPGPLEIIDQLGDWHPLLYVSHQVRAITLRLCIMGGSNLAHSKGLCIVSSSYRSFVERINRLGEYYQMTSPNSIPTSPTEEALSKIYSRFPHIYPHLAQYATLRHGIQKISIGMDFLSFMQFFKVTTGVFQRFHRKKDPTYEVFERLPDLNEIVIRLPLRPHGGWKDTPLGGGPQLWHEDSPCPRVLHRVIYERVAEVLALYKVTVRNFIDSEEKQRFEATRLKAVKGLKFMRFELDELYAEDGGGVELTAEEQAVELPRVKREDVDAEDSENLQSGFFPPLCHCDEPCILAPVLDASEYHS